MRIDFVTEGTVPVERLRSEFLEVAAQFGMRFVLWDSKAPYRR